MYNRRFTVVLIESTTVSSRSKSHRRTATSPPPDRALHWLLLFPPSPYRSPAAHPPLCGRQAVHRPPGGPAFSRLAYGQSGPTRALERPHRGSTPTSDLCGTYVRPPQRILTPKYPVPAPPSFKCRGMFGDQRTSDRFRGRFRCMAPLWFLILRPLQRSHAGHP